MSSASMAPYLSRKRPRLTSLSRSDVVDLDSDSEDYIFKQDKQPTSVINTKRKNLASLDAALYDEDSTVIDEELSYNSSWLGVLSPHHRSNLDRIASPNSNSTCSSDSEIDRPVVHRLKRKRRQSATIAQLPYSRLRYVPLIDRRSVLQKIGEVSAQLVPPQNNYTYGNSAAERKFSFDCQVEEPDDLFEGHSGSTASSEEPICDEKDGHYIVVPGASFANDRFEIRGLLGQGTFGKVVEAYDRASHATVAIKIIKSIPKYREASKIELRVLSMLKRHDPHNTYQCIRLRECFDYRDHICIVTDMLKISLYDFLENNKFLPFPGSHIQAIAKQLLRSVAFLHDLNLIHTDLKPENILLQDDSYVRKPYRKPRSPKVLSRRVLRDPKIFTIDFGSAIFDDEYHSSVVSTRHYRAPEIVLGVGWSFACDIWSVGCILVELLTGEALFRTHENVQHLAMMEKVIGTPVDMRLVRQCISHFYHSNGRRRESRHSSDDCIADAFSHSTGRLLFPAVSTPRKLVNEVDQLPHICDTIGSKVGFRFNPSLSLNDSISAFKVPTSKRTEYKFWYSFIDLIRRMLVFDPQQRITAMQAMEHQWFACGIMDDGLHA